MAKELLFDLAGHLLLDLRGRGARIAGENESRADRDLRVLTARHREERADAEQHRECGEDKDDGAILECRANGVHCLAPPTSFCTVALAIVWTRAPSRRRCWPATTMRSPLVRPLVIS